MIEQIDKDLIRKELMQERHEEMQHEMRLHSDEEFALEQLVDSELIDMYDDLVKLANKINEYGWNISASDLIDRMG